MVPMGALSLVGDQILDLGSSSLDSLHIEGLALCKVAFQLNEDKTIEHDGFTTTMFYEC